jgi:hydrogenase maturation protein HypF
MTVRIHIKVRGAVQGVGFRPFIYRLAANHRIRGWVENTPSGVSIEAEGDQADVDAFMAGIASEKPPLAFIQGIETAVREPAGCAGFSIRESSHSGTPTAIILPDIALCPDCAAEISDPADRRYRYPFTNCTNCGPRFTIISDLPYDRPNTSMKSFTMCAECRKEYHDPGDRRFHAQPIACPDCGPHLSLLDRQGTILAERDDALVKSIELIRGGEIIALKGLGGFQLIADASNGRAVEKLRIRKRRGAKPFAVMLPGMSDVRTACATSPLEERLLQSPESPIVVLDRKGGYERVAEAVAPGSPTLGIMLPTTPLHHLLLTGLGSPVVATSGNLSDEPMCIGNDEARERLSGIADFFLVHDRPILRHADDSIVRAVMDRPLILRRARGFAPLPLAFDNDGARDDILAVGAHLKNTIALSRGNELFISQHIGDLESPESLKAFAATAADLSAMLRISPSLVVSDMHPDYLSSGYARTAAPRHVTVQHHAAHVASCMADNGLSGTVLGFAWDGSGYGPDGTVWGGEAFLTDGCSWQRFASIVPFRLPGGDSAAREPRRTALGLIGALKGPNAVRTGTLPFDTGFTPSERAAIALMIDRGINTPVTTSIGRLFDGVAAIIGLCLRSDFEGEAAMKLEHEAGKGAAARPYPFLLSENAHHSGDHTRPRWVADWRPMLDSILDDLTGPATAGEIARRFHLTLDAIAIDIVARSGNARVVLSGGCFQNKLLSELLIKDLRKHGASPYWHQRIPPNDGGISAGQVFAARTISPFTQGAGHVPGSSR